MSKSCAENQPRHSDASPEKNISVFSANRRTVGPAGFETVTPGSMHDAPIVREVITESMRKCGLSRVVIAERMSYLTGTAVTERMLNNFSAESREDARFPAELERAFCAAVGDTRLMTCRAELAGLHLVDDTALDLMELGRQYLRERDAAERKANLEARLRREVDLG